MSSLGQRLRDSSQKSPAKRQDQAGTRKLRPLKPSAAGIVPDETGTNTEPDSPQEQRSLSTNGAFLQTDLNGSPLDFNWVSHSLTIDAAHISLDDLSVHPVAPLLPSGTDFTLTDLSNYWDSGFIGTFGEETSIFGDPECHVTTLPQPLPLWNQDDQYGNQTDPPIHWSLSPQVPLQRPDILIAALQNAICLGITRHELVTTQYRSPFYRPSTIADDTKALLSAASNPSFPEHLQPTLPQILFPHHAYLDLIPFPVLRARAITLAATRPQLFNWLDLKRDILKHGLVYLDGENNSRSNSHFGKSWNMRSWKMEPWFVKKWRMLIVGETIGVL